MEISAARLEEMKSRSHDLLLSNRRRFEQYQYTVPSPDTYPYQWLWDSCFHAIVLTHYDVEDAKKELLSLTAKQLGNGLLPHMIYWQRTAAIDIDWGRPDTSTITQPPIIASAVWTVYEKSGDRHFLETMYPALYHFYTYLLTDRDPRNNHLVSVINPDESGEDNSPRFDRAVGLPPQHNITENFAKRVELIALNKTCNFDAPFCMKNHFWIKDVPFNAILAEGLRDLERIADTLGFKEDALRFEERRVDLVKAMRDRMMREELFWSLEGPDYELIPVKTWAIFSPLYARILSEEEARSLVEKHLENAAEFWAPHGVRTVAKTEPSYDPKGWWRGPVWIATHWLIYRGLLSYGFTDIAHTIRARSLELVEQSGFREYFDPETGEGLGASDFTWGTLVVDMFERESVSTLESVKREAPAAAAAVE